uniref:Uncharacterized protein n=1 Tax=Theropithecus gelada TaxID=9565 RepID=A0A8D2GJD1_THEGE
MNYFTSCKLSHIHKMNTIEVSFLCDLSIRSVRRLLSISSLLSILKCMALILGVFLSLTSRVI